MRKLLFLLAAVSFLGAPGSPSCPVCNWTATNDDVVVTTSGWTVKIQVENTNSASLPGCGPTCTWT